MGARTPYHRNKFFWILLVLLALEKHLVKWKKDAGDTRRIG